MMLGLVPDHDLGRDLIRARPESKVRYQGQSGHCEHGSLMSAADPEWTLATCPLSEALHPNPANACGDLHPIA